MIDTYIDMQYQNFIAVSGNAWNRNGAIKSLDFVGLSCVKECEKTPIRHLSSPKGY